ncbi:MAG: VWA domain-containing protein, partial [Gemmatales bacterium]|nr:VWA domain-containing protein [Gemmatales bacterium]MDW8386406.1 VWA domain-containing protein [Gemmatales bacterium]
MFRLLPQIIALLCLITILGCGGKSARRTGEPQKPVYEIALPEVPATPAPLGSVGIMFCLDVSPSMNDAVQGVPKIQTSKAALKAVLRQIEEWSKDPANRDRLIKVGLIAFSGTADVIKPMQPFDLSALEAAVDQVRIGNATAIGNAMVLGTQELLQAGVENKALIVLTDGENNRGVAPELVVHALRNNWNNKGALTDDVKVFLIAYDIQAQIFDGVKQA